MRYLPHTPEDVAEMLRAIGVTDVDRLFSTVPPECRRSGELDVPGPLTEWELTEHLEDLASRNSGSKEYLTFLGGGSYEHVIPATVPYLASRSEFMTSYTPYQPEVSQGTLQAIYEYQTLAARLLGLDAANASLYDGASALAEAVLMACRVTGKNLIALSRAIHPAYRQVVKTYLQSSAFDVAEIPFGPHGTTALTDISSGEGLAGVVVQSPNVFGCVEDLSLAARIAHDSGALLVAGFSEPLAFGLYKSPGTLGADIACGEGQSFGIARSFGGPGLGMFATRLKHVRAMPGRLVGRAADRNGKQGFVLTLATREQHIRREKATSNICTNNSLCALTAAVYLASLGRSGLRELARLNYDKTEYLKGELLRAGFSLPFSSATFNEFVLRLGPDHEAIYRKLLERHIVAGVHLEAWYPELAGHYLICVTETKTRDQLDSFIAALCEATGSPLQEVGK